MKQVRTGEGRKLVTEKDAAIGIGSLIIFIAMLLVAGIAASVIIQTMNSLEQRAMETGEEVIRDISTGVKVTHISGHVSSSNITQLAIFLTPSTASNDVDLTYTYISLSDSATQVILSYTNTVYSSRVSNGVFGTVNSSNLSATTFGILVVRDVDSSCSLTTPIINDDDLIIMLVNTTDCFSGISTRTEVRGGVIPEYGMQGVIAFTTPAAYVDTIVDLQP